MHQENHIWFVVFVYDLLFLAHQNMCSELRMTHRSSTNDDGFCLFMEKYMLNSHKKHLKKNKYWSKQWPFKKNIYVEILFFLFKLYNFYY